jgi:hypothetical protein
MSITYAHQPKVKRQRPSLPQVAPTAALRADAALKDALRFSGSAVAQAFSGAMWAALLANLLTKENQLALGPWGIIGGGLLIFAMMAAFIWASMQGQAFGSQPYSSGMSSKFEGAAKYTLIAGLVIMALGLLAPVGMFFAWQRNAQLSGLISVMQLCIVVWQLLFSASFSLRAAQAIKYARVQLSGSAISAGLDVGVG